MRLSIAGVWIILISIVKCQAVPSTRCTDRLTEITLEVSPQTLASICADNSPTSILVATDTGFWIDNLQGFCTSSDLNIGSAQMNQQVTSQDLTLQILKNGQTLDAAKMAATGGDNPGTHLVTVWGHQNTRFVLKIVSECISDGKTPSTTPTIASVKTTFDINTNTVLTYLGPTNSNTTTKRSISSTPTITNIVTTQDTTLKNTISPNPVDNDCSISSNSVHCNITPTPDQSGNVQNENTTKTTTPSIHNNSLALAKLEWMEDKRKEFEKMMESFKYSVDNEQSYSGLPKVAPTPTLSITTASNNDINITQNDTNTRVYSSRSSTEYQQSSHSEITISPATRHSSTNGSYFQHHINPQSTTGTNLGDLFGLKEFRQTNPSDVYEPTKIEQVVLYSSFDHTETKSIYSYSYTYSKTNEVSDTSSTTHSFRPRGFTIDYREITPTRVTGVRDVRATSYKYSFSNKQDIPLTKALQNMKVLTDTPVLDVSVGPGAFFPVLNGIKHSSIHTNVNSISELTNNPHSSSTSPLPNLIPSRYDNTNGESKNIIDPSQTIPISSTISPSQSPSVLLVDNFSVSREFTMFSKENTVSSTLSTTDSSGQKPIPFSTHVVLLETHLLYSSESSILSQSSVISTLQLHRTSTSRIPLESSHDPSLHISPELSTTIKSSTLTIPSLQQESSSLPPRHFNPTEATLASSTTSTPVDISTISDIIGQNNENSTIPVKKVEDENEDLDEESFWPVVAALVVGIPSVVVFGIAIVVIHRRRLAKPSQTTTTVSSLNSQL